MGGGFLFLAIRASSLAQHHGRRANAQLPASGAVGGYLLVDWAIGAPLLGWLVSALAVIVATAVKEPRDPMRD
jgi:hypothetical protein